MCNCQVCKDSTHFRAELKLLPTEHQGVFAEAYDDLLHLELDRDYYQAIADGSWPSAKEIIDRFHSQPHDSERVSTAMTALPKFEEALLRLPESSQPYFKGVAERMLKTDAELAHLRNIVLNALPNSSDLLTQIRAARVQAVTSH